MQTVWSDPALLISSAAMDQGRKRLSRYVVRSGLVTQKAERRNRSCFRHSTPTRRVDSWLVATWVCMGASLLCALQPIQWFNGRALGCCCYSVRRHPSLECASPKLPSPRWHGSLRQPVFRAKIRHPLSIAAVIRVRRCSNPCTYMCRTDHLFENDGRRRGSATRSTPNPSSRLFFFKRPMV